MNSSSLSSRRCSALSASAFFWSNRAGLEFTSTTSNAATISSRLKTSRSSAMPHPAAPGSSASLRDEAAIAVYEQVRLRIPLGQLLVAIPENAWQVGELGHPFGDTDPNQRLVQRDLARRGRQRSSPRSTCVILINTSSTGLTKVYNGSPLARVSAKSGTTPAAKVVSPRTRSRQLMSSSGIRSRSTGLRPSSTNAARCASVRSRSKLS